MSEKKKYSKPSIKQIKLVPEEAVLVACKTKPGISRSTGTPGHCTRWGRHHTRCYHNAVT